MDRAALAEFRHTFKGHLVVPGDDGYEQARRVWNGAIDRRPAVIARCRDTADVARAIAFGREHALPIAVRGGAHSVAGNATVDDGLVIDLSPMKGIKVDAPGRRALAEPGLTWGEFDAATAALGLATTGGLVSTTGIAGFTLGGGIGWLMRAYGLTCDNLLRAEMVTADGEVVTADAESRPDLFWALRGGGGNFGVVTRFEYRLHPVAKVIGGLALHPAANAGAALRHFREVTASSPDELTALFAFLTAPPAPFVPSQLRGKPVVAIVLCYCGDPDGGERAVAPIRAFGAPAADVIGEMPYAALQAMLDMGAPSGFRNYWKSTFIETLSDAAIDTVVEHASRMASPMSQVHIQLMGGRMARVPPDATAFAHRSAALALNVVGMWSEPGEDERHTSWARTAAAAMEPFSSGGVYVNFLGNEGAQRVRAAYGETAYERLVDVKTRYDPDNVFHLNQNIPPRARERTTHVTPGT
jgi:FAD/FMN-containing dehydrogenase